jgi:hypothetical protein
MTTDVTIVFAIGAGLVLLWAIRRIANRGGAPRPKRRRRRYGSPIAAGAIYELLNEDRRKALEIIVEQRAEARDPEDKDGNLPDLEDPRGSDRVGASRPLRPQR